MIINNLICRLLFCADSLPLVKSSLNLGRIHLEAGSVELDHGSRKIVHLLEFANSLKLQCIIILWIRLGHGNLLPIENLCEPLPDPKPQVRWQQRSAHFRFR